MTSNVVPFPVSGQKRDMVAAFHRVPSRIEVLEGVLDSLEVELAEIKNWAPEGHWLQPRPGKKTQIRWEDKQGKTKARVARSSELRKWPQLELNRIRRYQLLAQIKDINRLIGSWREKRWE